MNKKMFVEFDCWSS